MVKATVAPQYSLVASNSDLNLRFDTDRFKLISTGTAGPVNGPTGSSAVAQWTLECLYWDQAEDVQPKVGIQKFENPNGTWIRKFTVSQSVSASFSTAWVQIDEYFDITVATDDVYFSGRMQTLSAIDFQVLYGNGSTYTQSVIKSTYPTGIPGILERTVDTAVVGSTASEISAGDQTVWHLRCQPTHLVTIGRPRTQIVGAELDFYVPYRMSLRFKLHQTGAMGWTDKTTEMPLAAMFALSQLGGSSPFDVSPGQQAAGTSPLYIILRGATLYPEIRGLIEELGVGPGDPGYGTYTEFDYGDTQRTSGHLTPVRCLYGNKYHEIVIDFLLDERRSKDGGQGYMDATFDGRPWFRLKGPTSAPRNASGNLLPIEPRIGFYEVSGSALSAGTLVSAAQNSTTVERSIKISRYSFTRNPPDSEV